MASYEERPGKDRRRHRRYPVDKALSAQTSRGRFPGRLRDISAGGAGVLLGETVESGDDITLEIDDLGAHTGHVVGPSRYDLIPIAFDNDEEDQDLLIAEIMKCQSDMIADEDG